MPWGSQGGASKAVAGCTAAVTAIGAVYLIVKRWGPQRVADPHASDSEPRKQDLYQWLWGDGWTSPGGEQVTVELLELLQLRIPAIRPMQAIDIHTGTGGAAFYMSDRYGATVTAIDTQPQLIGEARGRVRALFRGKNIPEFAVQDILALCEPVQPEPRSSQQDRHGGADLIWCREGFLYYTDSEKRGIFRHLAALLRVDGVLAFTEFCKKPGPMGSSPGVFQHFILAQGYDLYSISEYRGVLEDCIPDRQIEAFDISDMLVAQFEHDLEILATRKDEFVEKFSLAAWDDLCTELRSKYVWLEAGHLTLGLFVAKKSL